MRQLYLLRHAEAAPARNSEDRYRPLTGAGMAMAHELGRLMKARNYIPDFVVCSPARRAQQTLRKLCETLGEIPAISPPAAYYSTMGQLYECLKEVDGRSRNLLLVSHNPSIHTLARFLAGIGIGQAMAQLRQ